MITTGYASREGTAEDNADAGRVYRLADGTVGAAVIDGIGHGPRTSSTAPLLAEVAARISARRGPLAGLLTASELIADKGPDDQEADAVAVAARAIPGNDVIVINWTGDCRAYGWNGERLELYTDDHTVGKQLRANGVALEIARAHDNWLRTSLARATVGTVYTAGIRDQLVILTSDGVHDQIPEEELTALVAEHSADPQRLADALVTAARADEKNYRDDATAVVLSTQPHGEEARPMNDDRVTVRVLLLFGDQAEIVADVPHDERAEPERYPAAEIAEAVGVPVRDLPGLRLTAVVGDDDKLSGWRLA